MSSLRTHVWLHVRTQANPQVKEQVRFNVYDDLWHQMLVKVSRAGNEGCKEWSQAYEDLQ